jgi:hypothetical protein
LPLGWQEPDQYRCGRTLPTFHTISEVPACPNIASRGRSAISVKSRAICLSEQAIFQRVLLTRAISWSYVFEIEAITRSFPK